MTIEAYKYKPSVEECKAIFVASCIETTAKATGVTPEAMYQRMVRIGLIKDYILPCYNVLHRGRYYFGTPKLRILTRQGFAIFLLCFLCGNCTIETVTK